jgi:hypothetical protein
VSALHKAPRRARLAGALICAMIWLSVMHGVAGDAFPALAGLVFASLLLLAYDRAYLP